MRVFNLSRNWALNRRENHIIQVDKVGFNTIISLYFQHADKQILAFR
jgi:hypothetical protein